jgi:alkylation response protein AidB-like acyl-CoA dehydrogenase
MRSRLRAPLGSVRLVGKQKGRRAVELSTAVPPAIAGAVDGRWDTTEGASRQAARGGPRAASGRVDGRFDFLNDFNAFNGSEARRKATKPSRASEARSEAKPSGGGGAGCAGAVPAMIGFEPSDEQRLILETVRQFAVSEVRPRARECAEARKLPDDVIARAHQLGLVASALPAASGGGGERSAVTGALIAEELAWGDLSIALAILSPSLVALPVADFGTAEQQQAWLPRYLTDRFVPGSLALVEPSFGFDAFKPASTAKRHGDGFRLDGDKCFVPWLPGDDGVLVIASEQGAAQVFRVPRDAEGLTAIPERNLGLDALPTALLRLRGVKVAASDRLGGARGADVASLVSRGRVALAAAAVGVARAAYELALDYAKQRHAFGAPIATKQAIAFKLAEMAIEIDGARLLAWEAADRLDRGLPALREAALAQQQAQRVALDVADGAVQVFGGHGYIRDYLPEMHLRNARGFACFEALSLV